MNALLCKLFDNAEIQRRLTLNEALAEAQAMRDERSMWDYDGTKSPYAWSEEAGETA